MYPLLLSFLVAAAPPAAEAPAVAPPGEAAPEAAPRLVWTGGLGGIGSGSYRFVVHERLTPGQTPSMRAIHPVHGWLAQGGFLLRADDGRIATLVDLTAGEPTCTPIAPGVALTSLTEHLLLPGQLPAWTALWPGARRPTRRWRCVRGEAEATLTGLDPGPAGTANGGATEAPDWDPARWETRLGLRWDLDDGTVLDVVGVPQQEGARRIAALTQEVGSGALFVDAGSFVDGASSVQDAGLSLHRPTGFAALRALRPAALVPGYTELIAGYDALKSEAEGLPYLAANWVAADPARALPASRIVEAPDGTARIGFVGAVDPALAGRIPELGRQGITLSDPVAALPVVVAELRGGEHAANLVVLVATLSPERLAAVRRGVSGIDLVIGDNGADLLGVGSLRIDLVRPGPWIEPTAVALPLGGVSTGRLLRDEAGGLAAIEVAPLPVTPERSPDQEALARVTRVRLDTYPALDRPLLPAPAGAPSSRLPRSTFTKVVCEAVQDEHEADLVLLPELRGPTTPGPLTALLVADLLALPDRLEVHRVDGDRFAKLLDQLVGLVPVSCGAPFAKKAAKARGRALDADRTYRILTTDRFRQGNPELASLLDTARGTPGVLDPAVLAPARAADGRPATLRGTALAALDRLALEHGDGLITELASRDASRMEPLWLARVRQLSLRAEGFQGVEDDAYGEIPETLATSPSSFTLGAAADVAVDYSSRGVVWDLRGRGVLTRLRTGEVVQETADDLKLSSSVTLPGLSTPPVAGISTRPYAEALYDSEITAVGAEDGSLNPLQRDASVTVGAAASPKGVLRTLRVGAFGLLDLSRPEKQPELGGRAEVETRVSFSRALRWTTQLDTFVYGSTPDDDASDLRFKARLDTRLQLPLARWLDVATYGTGFAFAGRVPETRAAAASWSVGVSLDVGGVFEL